MREKWLTSLLQLKVLGHLTLFHMLMPRNIKFTPELMPSVNAISMNFQKISLSRIWWMLFMTKMLDLLPILELRVFHGAPIVFMPLELNSMKIWWKLSTSVLNPFNPDISQLKTNHMWSCKKLIFLKRLSQTQILKVSLAKTQSPKNSLVKDSVYYTSDTFNNINFLIFNIQI